MFILGTDTDVGKTIVASAFVTGLIAKAHAQAQVQEQAAGQGPVRYWKPVQAGLPETDSKTLKDACPEVVLLESRYCYAKPASPDQADEAESNPVVVTELVTAWLEKLTDDSPLVVEGAGGLMVPLNLKGDTWLEVLEQLESQSPYHTPIVLVARSGLGTLNHTILTVEALRSRGLEPLAVVLNGPKHDANRASLARRFPNLPLINFLPIEASADAKLHRNPAWSPACAALTEAILTLHRKTIGNSNSWLVHKQSVDQEALEQHCWHPYTQHQTAPLPKLVTRSSGGFYINAEDDGPHKVYDGLGSWWVNTVGHGRGEIAEAVARQMRRNDHSIFAAASHEPALQLAKRITGHLGHGLNKVFFTENGSCAVEVGLKMAYQGFSNRGETRRQTFVALKGAYHGDTFGTMAAGGMAGFHGMFKPFLFDVHHIAPVTSHPCAWCPEPDLEKALKGLDQLFADKGDTFCGVLLEPYIQGAGGMIFHHPQFVAHLAQLAKDHGVPLIFDEVFTGMGRLGLPFAFHLLDITPDIICLAKGLTGGTLPLALTVATDEVFARFLDEDAGKALLHGHSFTANPAGCAAALATLDIYDREDLWHSGKNYEQLYRAFIEEAARTELIENGRCLGSVLAMEVHGSGAGDYFSGAAKAVVERCYQLGLFIRPLGNTLYLAPPLSLADDDIRTMLRLLSQALHESKKRP